MATKKHPTGGQIPSGFTSPFSRVPMNHERGDDALACIATLCGKTLDEVTSLAVQLGYPKQGPAYVANNRLMSQVLHNLGLSGGEWQEVPSFDALPDVAILMIDWNPVLELGRHVVWHHIRGSDAHPAFSYIIDPAPNLPPEQQVTSTWSHLRLEPAWCIEITSRSNGNGKRK